jgi:hypothetical protein
LNRRRHTLDVATTSRRRHASSAAKNAHDATGVSGFRLNGRRPT